MVSDDGKARVSVRPILIALALLGAIGASTHLARDMIAVPHANFPADHRPRKAAQAPDGTIPPAVALAQESLAILDEFDGINERLRPTGGIIGRVSVAVRGWLGSADIDRLAMLSAEASLNHYRAADDYLAAEMAGGVADAPVVPFATNVAFSRAARRDANNIINRYMYRDAYLASHGTLIGADADYELSHPADDGWAVVRVN